MPTITVRIPDGLKARIARLAKQTGTSSHAFILSAVTEKAEQIERRSDLHEVAEKRHAEILAAGETIAWADMQAYLRNRLDGIACARPVARSQRKT